MNKNKVLVVDDNELNRKVISRIVESIGFESVSAASGVEALQIYNHNRPDMILMDCRMPDMDGFDTTKMIRQIEKANDLNHIPVVAITADDKSDEWEKCVEAGMDGFLTKPVDVEKLKEMLNKFSVKIIKESLIDTNALLISADRDIVWAG